MGGALAGLVMVVTATDELGATTTTRFPSIPYRH